MACSRVNPTFILAFYLHVPDSSSSTPKLIVSQHMFNNHVMHHPENISLILTILESGNFSMYVCVNILYSMACLHNENNT
jgi:amino acid permease